MNTSPIKLLSGILLASVLLSGVANAHGPLGCDIEGGKKYSVEKMHEKMQKHHDKLKAELKLSPSQEVAWQQFINTMKPSAPPLAESCSKMKAEMEGKSKPERMEYRIQVAEKHHVAMKEQLAAMKAFYAQLSPEQQQVFDAAKMKGPKKR